MKQAEKSKINFRALCYENAADELAPWDAARAEEYYKKTIDLLNSIDATDSEVMAKTLIKIAGVQWAQGKDEFANNSMKQYRILCEKLNGKKKQILPAIPDCLNLGEEQKSQDYALFEAYQTALDKESYKNDYCPSICDFFAKRCLALCVGNPVGGILLTGVNPSYISPENCDMDRDYFYTFMTGKGGYWERNREMLGNKLSKKTAYLDLFPFKFTCQNEFEGLMEGNFGLRATIVSITQLEIETHLKPSLIIVANQQSSYYWGRNEDSTWMGYAGLGVNDALKKEELPVDLRDRDIIVCQIRGFKNNDDRLNKDKLSRTSLAGSLVLFYGMYDHRHYNNPKVANKILTPEQFGVLYEFAKDRKKEWLENFS